MPKTNKLQSRFLELGNYPDSPGLTRVQIRILLIFVQLCCEFTRVNAFTPLHKRIGTYLAKYICTFFSGLIFLRVDPNRIPFLRIASKQLKLMRTNIYTFLQFTRGNLHGINEP